ncbi:diphthamide biosynthesis enzyme Dph2 [Caldiplasma sukawensis]
MPYIDPKGTIEKLEKMGAKKVLLQLPDGLKPHVFEYVNALNKKFEVVVSSSGFYGACDTGTKDEYSSVDCVVQFGHTEIPNLNYGVPVIFEEYVNEPVIKPEEIDLSELEKNQYKKINIVYSIQYRKDADIFSEFLRSKGYQVLYGENDSRLKYRGQVLGCNYSPIHQADAQCDCHIVVSTGKFHAIGAQLSTKKEVFLLDLTERYHLIPMKSEVDRLIRKRYAQMEKALSAEKFVVVIDTKVGQFRKKMAENIIKKLESIGKQAVIAYSNESLPSDYENMRADCVIFTGCPRVPIDDQDKYSMPVLTPREFESIFFRNGQGYVFDEIVRVDS